MDNQFKLELPEAVAEVGKLVKRAEPRILET